MDENPNPTRSRIEQLLLEIEASLRRSAAELAGVRQQIKNLPGGTPTAGGGDQGLGTEQIDGGVAESAGPKDTGGIDAGQWLTLVYAAQIATVDRATIGRLANMGKVVDNGRKGKQRRVLKDSLLQWMGKQVEQQRQRAFADYERDLKRIPEQY
jgi:hypothetical protein